MPRASNPAGQDGGAKKATSAKATPKRQDVSEKALADGVTPLEVMLGTMRAMWARAGRSRKSEDKATYQAKAAGLAKDVAPYVHPRLTAVDHKGDMTLRHEDWLEKLPD